MELAYAYDIRTNETHVLAGNGIEFLMFIFISFK